MTYRHSIDSTIQVYDVGGNLHTATVVDRYTPKEGSPRYLCHIMTMPAGTPFIIWVPEEETKSV